MAARRIATLFALGALLSTGIVGTAHATPPPPPPLVTNGDFETSPIVPWLTSGSVREAGPGDWVAASGTHSLELFSYGWARELISTTAGQRYDLSFAYAGNPSATCAPVKTLDVTWNDGDPGYGPDGTSLSFDTTGHSTAAMGWQTAHVLVDATSTDTYIEFHDYGDPDCGVVIDNVAMGAPPAGQTGIELTTGAIYPFYGESIPLTATVIGASSAVTPTGSVQFAVDGVAEGSPIALSGGQAQGSVTDLAPGEHTVSASYVPDSGLSSSSVTRRLTAIKGQTSTALNAYPGPTPLGQEVVATADVDVTSGSGQATGNVQFGDEYGPIGDPVEVDADGIAHIALLEDVGYHYLYATYAGDDFFTSSTGYATLDIFDPTPTTDGRSATTTSVVSSKNPIAPGEPYTATATVSPSTASDAALDGTITFTVNGVAVGEPVPLDGNRSASITRTPPAGVLRETLRARYGGNGNFLPSTGSLSERISAPTTATSTPPPAAPDTAAPIFTVGLTTGRLAKALRNGIRAHVDCNENCSTSLELRLTARRARALGMRIRGASIVVGRGSYDFADRRASDVVVRFTARSRKALAKARKVALRLTTTTTDLTGNDAVHVQTVTLKR